MFQAVAVQDLPVALLLVILAPGNNEQFFRRERARPIGLGSQ